MVVKILKSKLHGARVTDARLHYPGSMAVDSSLMEATDILPYESVLVADVDNGSRLETYVIPAEAGSSETAIFGAAAHLIKPKDIVIILGFGDLTPDEDRDFKPKIVVLDENNKIIN